MFAFITCLRHPRTVKSMPMMLALLERTLETIEAQTNKNYSVTVVCHEIPKLSRTFERVEFLIVDFEPPAENFEALVYSESLANQKKVFRRRDALNGISENCLSKLASFLREALEVRFTHFSGTFSTKSTESRSNLSTASLRLEMVKLDKGRKYLAGLYHIRKNPPSHVMFFDADDCLAPDIVETVLSGPAHTSWYVGDGYIYSEGSGWIVHRKHDFNMHCGTCYVFDFDIYKDLPSNISDVSEEWMKNNLGSHRLVHTFLAEK